MGMKGFLAPIALLAVSAQGTQGWGGPLEDAVTVQAEPVIGGTRAQIKGPVAVVVLPAVQDVLTVKYQGVEVTWKDFRASVADALRKAVSRNSPGVEVAWSESKRGLEFVVDSLSIDESNFSLRYSAVMTHDGKEIASMTANLPMNTRVVSSSAFTYKRDIRKKVMLPGMKELLERFAVDVYGNTLMSQKLEDNGFWAKMTGAADPPGAAPRTPPKEPPEPDAADETLAALASKDPAARAVAAQVLGEQRSRKAVVPLLRSLADPDRGVRANAADALGAIGDRRAVGHLIRALEAKDPVLRAVAVRALGRIGSGRARGPLQGLLAKEKDARVRAATEKALKEIEAADFTKVDVDWLGDPADADSAREP